MAEQGLAWIVKRQILSKALKDRKQWMVMIASGIYKKNGNSILNKNIYKYK